MSLINPFFVAPGITGTTWNPSDKGSNVTLSNGNLTFANSGGGGQGTVRATTSHATTGKYYFEVHIDTVSTHYPQIGVCTSSVAFGTIIGTSASSGWSWQADNTAVWHNGANISSGVNFTTNDVVQVAIDFAASKIWFGKNNTYILSGNPGAGTNATFSDIAGTLFPAASTSSAVDGGTGRFTSASFSFSPPSGFTEW